MSVYSNLLNLILRINSLCKNEVLKRCWC